MKKNEWQTTFMLWIMSIVLESDLSCNCINILFFITGCCIATPCSLAVWEWIYFHHLVPSRSNKFRQHREGETLFVLVLLSLHVVFITCVMVVCICLCVCVCGCMNIWLHWHPSVLQWNACSYLFFTVNIIMILIYFDNYFYTHCVL